MISISYYYFNSSFVYGVMLFVYFHGGGHGGDDGDDRDDRDDRELLTSCNEILLLDLWVCFIMRRVNWVLLVFEDGLCLFFYYRNADGGMYSYSYMSIEILLGFIRLFLLLLLLEFFISCDYLCWDPDFGLVYLLLSLFIYLNYSLFLISLVSFLSFLSLDVRQFLIQSHPPTLYLYLYLYLYLFYGYTLCLSASSSYLLFLLALLWLCFKSSTMLLYS